MELQAGALLQGGKYKIEKSLGQGGFGITYLAEQTNLGRKVCIKEFFMKEYGERTTSQEVDSEETVLTNGAPMSSQASKDKDSTVLTGVSAVTSAAAAVSPAPVTWNSFRSAASSPSRAAAATTGLNTEPAL